MVAPHVAGIRGAWRGQAHCGHHGRQVAVAATVKSVQAHRSVSASWGAALCGEVTAARCGKGRAAQYDVELHAVHCGGLPAAVLCAEEAASPASGKPSLESLHLRHISAVWEVHPEYVKPHRGGKKERSSTQLSAWSQLGLAYSP
eukprot:CAMPEP_0172863756 /NCGR_PEP_ID=MMETSP1075-20121228/78282_1 /TAXON_ID=2916 /ORGANISM="Ceratium fusus, Strain PA161109" /LENGTH=144 /DNA_ID=CAMNT_0013712459 /DNA_START=238 /DNA_END=671 /DNA_ORIENTATION=-